MHCILVGGNFLTWFRAREAILTNYADRPIFVSDEEMRLQR
jgi:hypothetical protein